MLSAVCATSLAFIADVEIRGEILRLGDVVNTAALPPAIAPRARETALLRLDQGLLQTAIPRRELAAQARARLPFLADCFTDTDGDPVIVRRRIAASAPRVTGNTAAGIAKGERVTVRITGPALAIERFGLAATSAKPGEQVFVRTPDGAAIRAVVAEETR